MYFVPVLLVGWRGEQWDLIEKRIQAMKIELSQKTEKPQKREASDATCFLEPFRSCLLFSFSCSQGSFLFHFPGKSGKEKRVSGIAFFPERGPKSVTCFVLGIPHIPLNGLSPLPRRLATKAWPNIEDVSQEMYYTKTQTGEEDLFVSLAMRCRFVRFFLSGRHDTVISQELRRECRIHYSAVQKEKPEH